MAFGGPVAQIAMLQEELVEEERWVEPERFRRALALYQALPGPEAHELCVWFGTVARGRLGGLVAGLGFMLPGVALVLALAAAYVRLAPFPPLVLAALAGMQAAVVALIVRAAQRIATVALRDRTAAAIAVGAALATLVGAPFALVLGAGGAVYVARRAGGRGRTLLVALAATAAVAAWTRLAPVGSDGAFAAPRDAAAGPPSYAALAASGLEAGLLTFGGAYTAIPLVRADAVGRWTSERAFLDGVALSGILPAPLSVFATFTGYLAAGLPGAILMTAGIFAPAFAFTLLGHDALERLAARRGLREFLDGVTAAVVGLIVATAIALSPAATRSAATALVAVAALVLLVLLRSRFAVLWVMAASAAAGALFA